MRASLSFVLLNSRFRGFAALTALVALSLVLTACANRQRAPVEDRTFPRSPPPATGVAPASAQGAAEAPAVVTYTVKRGDTLYQIALDNGLDYRDLAAWNNIENINMIRVGQVLRLAAQGSTPVAPAAGGSEDATAGVVTAPLRSAPPPMAEGPAGPSTGAGTARPVTSPAIPAAPASTSTPTTGSLKNSPKAIKEPYSDHAVRELTLAASAGPAPRDSLAMAAPGGVRVEPRPEPPAAQPPTVAQPPAPATTGDADRLDWAWPAKGRIIAGFSETANLKGIDIAGTAGEAVHASAPGRVVYAGSGLRGYGKLIIIKHNATYLSAYAHNREILVKEGQQVTRGQKIAEMGSTDADQVKLHFEIRRLGKPMDPAKYLPPA